MDRSTPILTVILFLAFASTVGAQTPLECGIVDIDGPSQVGPGEPLQFKAKITGMSHTTKPEFKWKVSAGTITAGQGTDEITVDSVGLNGLDLIVTVELSGAPLGCKGTASRTTQVKPFGFVCGLPLDSFGDIKFEDEKARLDNFAIQLSNEFLAIGYILMSAGQRTFKGEAQARLARAKSYLMNVRGMDPNRIVTVDCGFSQELSIKLYISPLGPTPPDCSVLTPIPFHEVKFTKSRPKRLKKQQ